MIESTQKSRLLYAFLLSMGFHILLFILVGNIDWSRTREDTPYLGPLVVELEEPPVPAVSEPEPVPESPVASRVSESVPEVSPVPASAPSPAAPARADSPPRPAETAAPAGGAYADLFAGVTDTASAGGRAAPEPVDREDQVAPQQFSNRAGLETTGVATVTPQDSSAAVTGGEAPPDSLDLTGLDESLAQADLRQPGVTPGSGPAAGENEEIIVNLGEDSLFASRSLADRAKPIPVFTLDETLREALRQGENTQLEVEMGFSVTPDGILKDLHILHSSGNTSLDQELMKVLRVRWTFQPAPKEAEEEGRIIIRIKVE